MRCPRCNAHVMPGSDSCLSCGADLTRPLERERTLPSVARGNDLLEQRRNLSRERARGMLQREWGRGAADFSLLVSGLLRFIPPFWVAWESWALGLWFFRKSRWRAGFLAAAALLAAFLATVIDTQDRGNLSWSWPLLLFVLLGVALYAARLRFLEEKLVDEVRIWAMSLATVFTALGLGYGAVAFTQMAWFGDSTVRFLNADIEFSSGIVKIGSMIMTTHVREGEVKGGDILFRGDYPYRVVAAPGETIELRNCVLLIDGEKVPAFRDPVYQVWEQNGCANNLEPYTVSAGHWATLIPFVVQGKIEWRLDERALGGGRERAAYVIWPPGQWRRL